MRLIDADELKSIINGNENLTVFQKEELNLCVDACETAYDVDKVMERLKGQVHLNCFEPASLGYDKGMIEAIKIVKAGGAECQSRKQLNGKRRFGKHMMGFRKKQVRLAIWQYLLLKKSNSTGRWERWKNLQRWESRLK